MAPARPTWSSTPHPPAEGFAACRHYCPSPGPVDVGSPGGAGLTSKPHRDRSTRSRLTWAVSPAAGIGLPAQPCRWWGSLRGATTGPGGCHDTTLARTEENVRRETPTVFAETAARLGHRPQLTAFQPCRLPGFLTSRIAQPG